MRRVLLTMISLCMVCISASAQRLTYNADFDYIFQNREFDKSKNMFETSGTLHAARLTPYLNMDISSGHRTRTSLHLGVDFLKNTGNGILARDYSQEMLLYLQSQRRTGKGRLDWVAGVFPRSFSDGIYSAAFFSMEDVYLDNNFEGFFVKYSTGRLYSELGMDWCGMYSYDRREAFRLLSAGNYELSDIFSFGWAASMYHYANSVVERGVVDNSMVNPYFKMDFAGEEILEELSVSLGGLLTYQWDRRYEPKQRFPMGLESLQTVSTGWFSLENTFYFGDDLCPFFEKYGEGLYHGDPFYHTLQEDASWYDRLCLCIEPPIGRNLSLKATFSFHFGQPLNDLAAYRGTMQVLSLIYNFDRFR